MAFAFLVLDGSSADHAAHMQVDALDLARIGPAFEAHAAFPARTNTEFVEVLLLLHPCVCNQMYHR